MQFLFVGSHLCARASFRQILADLPLPSASGYASISDTPTGDFHPIRSCPCRAYFRCSGRLSAPLTTTLAAKNGLRRQERHKYDVVSSPPKTKRSPPQMTSRNGKDFFKEEELAGFFGRWGESPWTRIEETAIRNRAFEHGYDFVKVIPLDDKPTVPKWLPRTQLWVGLKRWGIAGAASVIEARIEELGGEPHQETIQERSDSLWSGQCSLNRPRKQFLGFRKGG